MVTIVVNRLEMQSGRGGDKIKHTPYGSTREAAIQSSEGQGGGGDARGASYTFSYLSFLL